MQRFSLLKGGVGGRQSHLWTGRLRYNWDAVTTSYPGWHLYWISVYLNILHMKNAELSVAFST